MGLALKWLKPQKNSESYGFYVDNSALLQMT